MYKRLYFLGIAAYVFMLILSILFYKERIIFLDAAFSLFNIIKDNGFSIQHYRFGDACTQILPVIATKAGLPLDLILRSYSAGYIIYYFITYFVCGSIFKRYDLALVILLMNVLFVSDTFYWMLSQLPQAIALLMILLAVVCSHEGTTSIFKWAIVLLLEVTIVFFHPLAVLVLIFAIVFFRLSKSLFAGTRALYIVGIIYIIVIVVKIAFFKDPYEVHSASGLRNLISLFPNYFTIFSNERFLYNCLVKYYWAPVLFIGIGTFYIKNRQFQKLLFITSFFLGYLWFVNILYPTAVTPEFYIENLYLPLSVFLGLPFVFDVLPAIEKNHIGSVVMVLIILSGGIRIYATHVPYTNRLVLERKYLDEYGDKKVILKAKKTDTDRLLMLWGTPYEFLLLSESERHKSASIIIDDDPPHRPWAVDQKKSLIVNWNIFPYEQLNRGYFQFTDTTSGYIIDPTGPINGH